MSPCSNHVLNKNHQSYKVLMTLYKLIQQQDAPEADIDTFSGVPLEYLYYKDVFNEVAEKKIEDL